MPSGRSAASAQHTSAPTTAPITAEAADSPNEPPKARSTLGSPSAARFASVGWPDASKNPEPTAMTAGTARKSST